MVYNLVGTLMGAQVKHLHLGVRVKCKSSHRRSSSIVQVDTYGKSVLGKSSIGAQ